MEKIIEQRHIETKAELRMLCEVIASIMQNNAHNEEQLKKLEGNFNFIFLFLFIFTIKLKITKILSNLQQTHQLLLRITQPQSHQASKFLLMQSRTHQ